MADPIQLSPLDDPNTYLQIAQQKYRNALNPRAVNAAREQQAGTAGPTGTAPQAPPGMTDPKTGISFSRPFTPEERLAQRAALLQKLQQMDAQDKAAQPAPAE